VVTSLQTNLAMIELVARCLGRLRDDVVFLGGAATALLITDAAAPDVRSTMDVDVIVEVTSTRDYYRLAEELRSLGFSEDTGEDAPLCRWRVGGIAVDIMPTDEKILGFGLPKLRSMFQRAPFISGLAVNWKNERRCPALLRPSCFIGIRQPGT